jgi:hypothetical protein
MFMAGEKRTAAAARRRPVKTGLIAEKRVC